MPTKFNPQFNVTLVKDGHKVRISAVSQEELDVQSAPYLSGGYVKE